MKILSFAVDGRLRLGALISGDRVLDLTNVYPTALAFLEGGEAAMAAVRSAVERAQNGEALAGQVLPLDAVRLKPPVPQARKLLALAGNYQEHIREGGRPNHEKGETYPYFFMKPPSTTLVGSGEPVRYPSFARKLDYEGELTIVIGRRGRSIAVDDAYSYVAGYTVMNDISERALASKEPPKAERERNKFFDWLVGKWFDSAAPCGPWLVTRDEIEDLHALRLQTRVNGETRQDASTGEMIFTVPEIIAFISQVVTLEPGDLIATGTPGGVGSARGVFLKPGDTVEVEIERLGTLVSPLVAEE
ncbi:MAG TPA: fumarylacetoacetate hydrolase family protein [Armatimonadota bacterium]|nr:fumarylacetoacetate hydrolase family protein [Armatimonadota bacterium]